MYAVKKNYCRCHEESCGCDAWVITEDGEYFMPVFDEETALFVTKALNYYSESKKIKNLV